MEFRESMLVIRNDICYHEIRFMKAFRVGGACYEIIPVGVVRRLFAGFCGCSVSSETSESKSVASRMLVFFDLVVFWLTCRRDPGVI